MQAFFLFLTAIAVWLITSGFIYGGYYILSFFGFMKENAFTFEEALSMGEYIALSLIIAGVIALFLDAFEIIDLKCLFKKTSKRQGAQNGK